MSDATEWMRGPKVILTLFGACVALGILGWLIRH
jgi:hypothetical protein